MAKIKFEISGEFEEATVENFANYIGYTENTNISKIIYVENYIRVKMISLLSTMPIEQQKANLYAQQEVAIQQIENTVLSELEQIVNSTSTKIY